MSNIESFKERTKHIEVIVYRRPNMFIVNENMYNQIGVGALRKLFEVENYKAREGEELELFYPERFLNIVEQRALVNRITDAGFSKCRIITSSAFIIQSSANVGIAQVEDEYLGEDKFKLSSDDVGLPDDSGLGFL